MKLSGSTKNLMYKTSTGENVPSLDVVQVVSAQKSEVFYA